MVDRRFVLVGAIALLLIVGGLSALMIQRDQAQQGPLQRDDGQQGVAQAGDVSADADGTVEVGGVRRPGRDFPGDASQAVDANQAVAKQDSEPAAGEDPFDYGKTPPVKPDANPQVAGVVAAIRQKRNPEQVSALIKPPPFDRAAFQADPTTYVNTIEPGRVFEVLQPGPDVPALRKVSPRYQEARQGESVYLRATAPVGAPVTFTSLDLGQFENQLTSITVVANEEGVATASFTGTSGTINDVNIVAGSPLASGNVNFVVNVFR